uniref:Uncharacterized protein n=1 Tax=Trieres chinensis TaxID=1514140 RepID=A0A7S2EUL1_TRICV|mmetsp:Transcript_38444/g.78422  ORF Transcript_38444/g.78422 Transcript_38444/m.78422 type:complete len:186 (+) Transcript_38444:141-698(+)
MIMYLVSYSPFRARKTWITINSMCLLWSILLILELAFTLDPLDRLEGTRVYLSYNFVTTIIWLLEVGLTLADVYATNHRESCFECLHFRTRQDVELMVELIVALYFFGGSLQVFFQWYTVDTNVSGQFVDAILNLVAYAYLLWRVMSDRSSDSDGGFYDEGENYDSTKQDEQSDSPCQELAGESA